MQQRHWSDRPQRAGHVVAPATLGLVTMPCPEPQRCVACDQTDRLLSRASGTARGEEIAAYFARALSRDSGRPGGVVHASPGLSRNPWGLLPRVDLGHESDFVAVDVIGGDRAIGAIPGLEDDDRDHQRGGERGGEGVCIFAGHLLGSCLWRRGTIPRATGPRRPEYWLTSPGAFGQESETWPNPPGGTGLPVVRPLAG
mgnify:CR=1 FL=1